MTSGTTDREGWRGDAWSDQPTNQAGQPGERVPATPTSSRRGGRSSASCNPTSGPGWRPARPVTLHGNQAIIEVVDEFTRGQLEGRLRAQIEEGLTAVFGREIRLGVTVNPQLVADRAAVAAAAPESHHVDKSTHLPSRHVDIWTSRPGPAFTD